MVRESRECRPSTGTFAYCVNSFPHLDEPAQFSFRTAVSVRVLDGARGKAGPGRGKRGSKQEPRLDAPPTMGELGINDKKLSSRAQELASAPEADFEAALNVPPNQEAPTRIAS